MVISVGTRYFSRSLVIIPSRFNVKNSVVSCHTLKCIIYVVMKRNMKKKGCQKIIILTILHEKLILLGHLFFCNFSSTLYSKWKVRSSCKCSLFPRRWVAHSWNPKKKKSGATSAQCSHMHLFNGHFPIREVTISIRIGMVYTHTRTLTEPYKLRGKAGSGFCAIFLPRSLGNLSMNGTM